MLRPVVCAWISVFALIAPFASAQEAKKKPDPAFEKVIDDPKLPRVLIIGDSISIGYTPATRQLLKGKANVHRIPENAADTRTGLAKMKAWLGTGTWDVIHFNWGLHDIKMGTGQHQVPIEMYEKNLNDLVSLLKMTKAKLIWASTTPVPDTKLNPPRRPDDVIAYNKVAKKVMDANGVTVNDLHAFAAPKLKDIQLPANVHFSGPGSAVLAGEVVRVIEKNLGLKEAPR